MNRIWTIGLGCAAASAGSAQSINSFVNVASITGVSTSLVGNSLSLSVGAAPTFTMTSITYNITEVWGVWALDDNDDMAGTGNDDAPWNFNSNFASQGGIAGWKAQTPNQGLIATQSKGFTYTSLTGSVEGIGYHVRIAGSLPGGGNTIHIRGPVPEPASLAVLGLGLAAFVRRRRKD